VPELRHLRYFVAVAEELNFSRAARRLHMAQPPLSVAIRQLEQEIGTSLFLRTSREVKLTEAGEALLDGARRTLQEAEAAVTAARRAGSGELGRLRIAYSWSARFEILPALGQALAARSSGVELLTEEMWNGRMPDALRSGAIDLAVSICPEVAGELTYERLRSEIVVALVTSTHPLAGRPSIRLEELRDDDFLIFPRELAPRLYDFLFGLCRAAGFEPHSSGESLHSRWTLGTWGASSVGLVPQAVARDLPRGVVAVPVESPPDRLETFLVWREGDDRPALGTFVDVARGVFAGDT
jgi:DNA-binding transcriptional LysR family regulator